MTPTDNFFYTWLEQLGKNASIKAQIETMNRKIESEEEGENAQHKKNLQDAVAKLQNEYKKIKEAADFNKKTLMDEVEKTDNKELIINPRELSEGGLTPHAYRVFINNGDLEYLTLK